MDTNKILSALRAERNRIDQAITALESLNSTGPTGRASVNKGGRRGRMTEAGRKRLSQLMKQRWAKGKMRRKKKTAA